MKVVTSATLWNDAVGKRISITWSEVDSIGKVTSDNNRIDRVITDASQNALMDQVLSVAQKLTDATDGDN